MRNWIVGVIVCAFGLASGCAPTFNWRETAIGDTRMLAMFPCKPENRQRQVTLAGQRVELSMRSCDTGGVTLAIGHARLAEPSQTTQALAQWRDVTLAGMRADPASVSTSAPNRLQPMPQRVAARAGGLSPGGDPLILQGLWFAQDSDVFMALLYARTARADVAESFFSGLRFQ